MEIIFKNLIEKLPFMGIVFNHEFEASKVNEDLINDYKECQYSVLIVAQNSKLNLTLICDEPYIKREYKNLDFNLEKFTGWLYKAEKSEINFSHLINVKSSPVVIKTNNQRKLWVLKISKWEFREE